MNLPRRRDGRDATRPGSFFSLRSPLSYVCMYVVRTRDTYERPIIDNTFRDPRVIHKKKPKTTHRYTLGTRESAIRMKRPVRTHDAPLSVANRRGRIRIRSVYGAPTDVVARRATAHLARERSTIERASERARERDAFGSVRSFDRSTDRRFGFGFGFGFEFDFHSSRLTRGRTARGAREGATAWRRRWRRERSRR